MIVSAEGLNLIKEFEGCQLKVYKDPVGIKTVGYGHTGADVNSMRVGTKITQAEADEYLRKDTEKAQADVNSFDGKYHWTQPQFDALVSFAFNLGSINQLTANGTRSIAQISAKIPAYNKASGKVLPGLTRRRNAEKALFDRTAQAVEKPKEEKKEPKTEGKYRAGCTYTTTVNLFVRDAAAGNIKKYSQLTPNGQKNSYSTNGKAVLRAGTRVTISKTQEVGGDIWAQIPSGWICAKHGGKEYVR